MQFSSSLGYTEEKIQIEAKLRASFMYFLRTFFELRTEREFLLSNPNGRESHFITIANALRSVYRGEIRRLMINVPPRYGKSEMMLNFMAYGLANYPDSNYIYVSYSQSLASFQTQTLRNIISLPYFKQMFNVGIDPKTSARDDFMTTQGGRIFAAGSGGTITGRGAGIKGADRWGGCIVIDDIHKPDEVTSDSIRTSTNEWFYETLQSRVNDPKTPIILMGQRTHEDDIFSYLKNKEKEHGLNEWKIISLEALDKAKNALYPEMHDKESLLKLKRESPYVFASQYQQNPIPAGGGVFNPDDFKLLDREPDVIKTFITADTAETDKDYNDSTVFSFWGLYRVKFGGVDAGIWAIHWIDCVEIKCEPKDLESELFSFYTGCLRHKVKPEFVALEKKSTGTTLVSTLKRMPGLKILPIERTRASGSKTARFLEAQPYVSRGQISLPELSNHTKMCIEHCKKITANDTHRFDDIADTMYDAIKLALIDGVILPKEENNDDYMRAMSAQYSTIQNMRRGIR